MTHIPVRDYALRYALKEATGPQRAAIGEKRLTKEILEKLTDLQWSEYRAEAEMYWKSIERLDGLEHCTDLRYLGFDGNWIRDLRPLAGLSRLEELWLVGNAVRDLEPLRGLKRLRTLVLGMNHPLESVAPLTGLPALEYLDISGTAVIDLAPLAGFPALTRLDWSTHGLREQPDDVAAKARSAATEVLRGLHARGVELQGEAARLVQE